MACVSKFLLKVCYVLEGDVYLTLDVCLEEKDTISMSTMEAKNDYQECEDTNDPIAK